MLKYVINYYKYKRLVNIFLFFIIKTINVLIFISILLIGVIFSIYNIIFFYKIIDLFKKIKINDVKLK